VTRSRSGGPNSQLTALVRIIRIFRDVGRKGFQNRQYQPDERDVFFVSTDRDATRLSVRLVPDAQKWLAIVRKGSGRRLGQPTRIDVWLELPAKAADSCVLVHVRDHFVGTLSDADSQIYLPILGRFSSNPNIVVMTVGMRSRDIDGRWRLDVISPEPGWTSTGSEDEG
jgi:hypothetical protein